MIREASLLFLQSFPGIVNLIKNSFEDLPKELKILRYQDSVEIYIARGMLVSCLIFVFFLNLINIILSIYTKNFIFSLSISFLSSSLLAFLGFIIYLKIPSFKINSMARSLEKELHESIYVFSTFINDKTPLHISIGNFIKSNPEYKLSKEFNDILKLIEIGGMSIINAIDKKIEMCYSNKLSRFLFGLLTTLKGGGSIKSYVSVFAKDEIEEYRNKIKESGRKAALIMQIYLIILVIGGMFINIIISVFSLIQPIQGIVEIQFLIGVVMIPLISIMISKLVRSMII